MNIETDRTLKITFTIAQSVIESTGCIRHVKHSTLTLLLVLFAQSNPHNETMLETTMHVSGDAHSCV